MLLLTQDFVFAAKMFFDFESEKCYSFTVKNIPGGHPAVQP